MARPVTEFHSSLSTAVIEALGTPIIDLDDRHMTADLIGRLNTGRVRVGDGATLTSADGDTFIGEVDELDPTRGVVRLRLS
jgi:hypothetical protein